jgi:hypothetical protein
MPSEALAEEGYANLEPQEATMRRDHFDQLPSFRNFA